MAFENRFNQVVIDARRGAIYDAKERPLAISVMTHTVIASPVDIIKSKKVDEVAGHLADILEIDKGEITRKINDNANRWFIYVKRRIPEEEAQALRDLKLPGISLQEEPMRVYPKGDLLANFLGFVGTDNTGLSGIEVSYNSVLSGMQGRMMLEQDHRGRNIPDGTLKVIPSQDGNSLVLTVDETIQYILQREIKLAVEKYRPEKMGILVMEPKTARVLGMAQYPTFDPNNFGEYDQQNWRNFLISDVYEPGSTFKTVIMAGALEEGIVSLNDQFYCGGAIKLEAGTMKCWRGLAHGHQSFVEGVQNSCNPMFIELGLRLGKEAIYKYINGFGFGKKTGVELSGEAVGILVPQKSCRELDIASMSIGQSNAVTPIQLLTAFCAITNGGNLMKPQIIKEIRNADGSVLETVEPELVRQVISSATSEKVLGVLETVVSSGTGKTAYIDGYRVGGKTGTAQKVMSGAGYSERESIVSFMGVAPVNDPQVVCLIIMDYPKGADLTGGSSCGPIFKAVMKDILSYLQVPTQVEPQRVTAPSLEEITLQDYTHLSVAEAENRAAAQGLTATITGTGRQVYGQLPLANTRMLRGGSVVLYTEIPKSIDTVQQVVTPELTGKNAMQMMEVAKECNLEFVISGTGIVMYQQPSPGVVVDMGSKVIVALEEPLEQGDYGDMAGP
jgi:stage V sporulation protein D (sporulation-specific penicillin-binding protein)